MPEPIKSNVIFEDLSARFQSTQTVAASPSAGTETTIATLTLANFNDIALVSGIRLEGWAAFTVGTNGVSARLRIRQTNISGTIVTDTGVTTGGIAAAALVVIDCEGLDTSAADAQIYKLTLLVGPGSAASTVSAVMLRCIAV